MSAQPAIANAEVNDYNDWQSIPVTALHAGLILDTDIYDGPNLLLREGTKITAGAVQGLLQRGYKSLRVRSRSKLAAAPADSLTHAISVSRQLYKEHGIELAIPDAELELATRQFEDYCSQLELGQQLDIAPLHGTVSNLTARLLENPGCAIKLVDLDHFDRYTYRHSINVGLFLLLIAKEWNLSEDEMASMVMSGLLHDLGKIRVGLDIINKPGPLTDDEWKLMRMHPLWSLEMVRADELGPAARSVILNHHERLDGTGYVSGLRGEQLDRYARLAGICDVYDALTTKRSYKDKMDFRRGVDIILQSCGTHFDPMIAHEFVRRVGRYPVGSVVRLSSEEIAVVVRVNADSISRPLVSLLRDADGSEKSSKLKLDLSLPGMPSIAGFIPTVQAAAA